MSKLETMLVDCPACGTAALLERCDSINADRAPHLRDQLVSGQLMGVRCYGCDGRFRADPLFTYFDQELGLWLNARPYGELARWSEVEVETHLAHLTLFLMNATPAVQALGEQLTPRLTFGWAALREKIVCRHAGLDDVALELAKLQILTSASGAELVDHGELRLTEVTKNHLRLAWLTGAVEHVHSVVELPRAVVEDINPHSAEWAALREQVASGFYVDMNRAIAA